MILRCGPPAAFRKGQGSDPASLPSSSARHPFPVADPSATGGVMLLDHEQVAMPGLKRPGWLGGAGKVALGVVGCQQVRGILRHSLRHVFWPHAWRSDLPVAAFFAAGFFGAESVAAGAFADDGAALPPID